MSPSILNAAPLFSLEGESSVVAANGVGAEIDTKDYDGNVGFYLLTKKTAGTSPTLAAKLTECATSGGSYTDVVGGGFTGLTTADGKQKLSLNVGNLKRYVKYAFVIGGTDSPSYNVAAVMVGAKKTLA